MLGLILAVSSTLFAPAYGISLLDSISTLPYSEHKSLRVFTHPNNSNRIQENTLYQGLYLQSDPTETIKNYLHKIGLDTSFQLHLEKKYRSYHDGHQIYQFTFKNGDIPICEHQIKAHIYDSTLPTITGTLPLSKPDRDSYHSSMWLPISEVFTISKSSSEIFNNPDLVKLTHSSKCLYQFAGNLVPVWKILVNYMGLNYAIFRDADEIYKLDKRFYQVSGTTQSYQVNSIDSSGLVTETFEFVGDTFLTSDKVTTKPNGVDRISSDQYNFVVEPENENFPEVNVFAQVSRMIAWFEENGFKWIEGELLTVKIHESIPGKNEDDPPNPNNALYLPAEYVDPDDPSITADVPSITLGDGDGVHLTNLALDADVSGHELGHHIVFQSVKSTQQLEVEDGSEELTDHSGAIHEGLADFFIFAKSGNTCLGESICPGSGSICSQQGQCLRNADNDLKYGSEEYWNITNDLYHLKGQLVSGLLWDIRTDPSVTGPDFDSLVIKAIEFLDARSTYSNLLLALVASDHHFYQGKFGCTIVDKAKARGFEQVINEIIPDCLNFVPNEDYEVTEKPSSPGGGDTTNAEGSPNPVVEFKKPEKRAKPEAKDLCGTIAATGALQNNTITHFLFIFLFIIPLIIAQSLQRMFRN